MAYATLSDVAARNAARGTYNANTIPNATQVAGFIADAAAQLDTWLIGMGYAAPFDAAIASGLVASTGVGLLRRWNTTGAALYVEESAQQPMNLKAFQDMWEEVRKAVQDRDMDLSLPMLADKANPRAPQPTVQPTFDFTNSTRHQRGSWDL